MELNIYCDGGARGNPGPAACAFVIYGEKSGLPRVVSRGKYLGAATNNVAEYTAVIEALSYLSNLGNLSDINVSFFLDSQLVVSQINGLFKVKNPRLRELLVNIHGLETEISNRYPLVTIRYVSIPRSQNSAADALVNATLDSFLR